MNEKNATFLLKEIRRLLDELEAEVRNHPDQYLPAKNIYSEVLMYEEYNDDDGYPD